ncbi:MAG: hypothetical protein NTV00_14000 [Methylococcales bacterium]|nr:hypothetical protein [Methylococcales bacterium]
MTLNKNERKTISLPLDVHNKAGEISKRAGIKQYEFIAAAIDLAFSDETIFQAIIEQHKKKTSLKGIDVEVRKKLESLSAKDLEELLKHLKK